MRLEPNLKPIAALLIAACGHASAGGPDRLSGLADDWRKARAEGQVSHVLEIDNDTLLLNRDDGFYTSGVRYTQRHAIADGSGTTVFGWRLGQELYTASDIKLPPEFVGPPNHPYAAWLFGGLFKEKHASDGTHFRFGIDIGCIGPCAGGEWSQTTLHRILNQPEPQAWSRQVKNEFGVVLHGEMALARWNLGSSVDVTPYVDGRFGNIFTDAGVGTILRAGQLGRLSGNSSFHGYFRLYGRAVGHNATLQGGYFSSGNPHTVEPEPFTGEAEAGVVWRSGPYGVTVGLVRRGNEIRALPDSIGAQNFVHLEFSYTPAR